MLAPVWAGAVVCISHGLFGIATKGLYLAGVHAAVSWPERGLTAAQKNLAALHDLAVFEPRRVADGTCRQAAVVVVCLPDAARRDTLS